jgi:hypothetical protein
MHDWGEEDFDWEGLNDAINIIVHEFKKWRIGVRQSKEKFGTARIYCTLGWYQLHNITHPGHCYSRYPKWLWKLDIYVLSKIVPWLNLIVIPIHKIVYRNAYKKACNKYPHLLVEICCCADYSELLDFYNKRCITN